MASIPAEDDVYNTSFSTQGTRSAPCTPHGHRKYKKSNVHLADIAASSILDDLNLIKDDSRHPFIDESQYKYHNPTTINVEPQTERIIQLQNNIALSTERAQIIAAISMAIVHIALLKDTLDTGHDSSKYYSALLGLIITALVLQVLIGLLAVFISFLKSHINDTSYKGCCSWSFSWLPCCSNAETAHVDIDRWLEEQDENERHEETVQPKKQGKWPWRYFQGNTSAYTLLDVYHAWKQQSIQAELRCADIEEEMRVLTGTVNKARKELQDLESLDEEGSAFEIRFNEIKDRLFQAEDARLKMEQRRFRARKLKTQGDLLRKHVELANKGLMLKNVSVWQNIINILIFIVIVLNGIIVGFGLSNK